MLKRRVILWPLITLILALIVGVLFDALALCGCLGLPLLIVMGALGALSDRKKRSTSVDEADSPGPRVRLEAGQAHSKAGRFAEAEALYASALEGIETAIQHTRRSFPWRTFSPFPNTDGVSRTMVRMARSDLYERQGRIEEALVEAEIALDAVGPTETESWLKRLPQRARAIPRVLAVLVALQALVNILLLGVALSGYIQLIQTAEVANIPALGAILGVGALLDVVSFLLTGVEIALPVMLWTRHRLAGYAVIGVFVAEVFETLLEVGGADSTLVLGFNVLTILFGLVCLALAVISLNEYGRSHFDSIRSSIHRKMADLAGQLGDGDTAALHQEQAQLCDPAGSSVQPGGWSVEEREPISRPQRIGIYASLVLMILLVCGSTLLLQAVGNGSETALAHYRQGNAYYEAGDMEQAIAAYDEAIALEAEFAEAYYNRGVAYVAAGDLEQAIRDYDAAIALYLAAIESGAAEPDPVQGLPVLWAAYFNRGNAHYLSGNLEQAILDYDEAMAWGADDANVTLNRGLARMDAGDLEGAVADLEQYLELAPDAENRPEIADLVERLRSAMERGWYEHPSGAFALATPSGWEVVEEDPISVLLSDGTSIAVAEFHDVEETFTSEALQAFAMDFMEAALDDYELETMDVQSSFIFALAAYTGSDGNAYRASFFFDQQETVVYLYLFVTSLDAYDETLAVRDEMLATYETNPAAAREALP